MGTHLYRKDITLQIHQGIRHKRTRGDVILPEGTNLNQELVKHGWQRWPH
jgi:endonuclease YncB( thermonuclease family)